MVKEQRPTVIVGNWKMFKNIADTKAFIHKLVPLIAENKNPVYLAVPFTAIHSAFNEAKNTGITIGAQNMNDAIEGAYTGEISAPMLAEAGAEFVILGHSERRYIFGEGNRFINKKMKRAFEQGIQPILCIGETGHERDRGITKDVLEDQLIHCLEGIADEQIMKMILAYEPVWAIGTGKTATPEEAQEMHAFCRELLAKRCSGKIADRVPILYGGSVKPDNIRSLLDKPDIDGALVGGASLSVDSFSQIVNYQTIMC